jgi:hypothetical protein
MLGRNEMQVPAAVWDKVQMAMRDLLKDPLPPYSVLGIDVVVHDGTIKRIKTRREVQIDTAQNNDAVIKITRKEAKNG